MSSGTERSMRSRSERRTLFPWMLVGAGALVYWTIALGIGIPSLADVLGAPRAVHRSANLDARCVTTASVDGRAVTFGDCFNVRFMLDSPELARPPHTVPRRVPATPRWHADPAPELQELADEPSPPALDSIGRTAY
jgi:hypothetical protein